MEILWITYYKWAETRFTMRLRSFLSCEKKNSSRYYKGFWGPFWNFRKWVECVRVILRDQTEKEAGKDETMERVRRFHSFIYNCVLHLCLDGLFHILIHNVCVYITLYPIILPLGYCIVLCYIIDIIFHHNIISHIQTIWMIHHKREIIGYV